MWPHRDNSGVEVMEEYNVVVDIDDIVDCEVDPFEFDYMTGVYPKAQVSWQQISDWLRAQREQIENNQKERSARWMMLKK